MRPPATRPGGSRSPTMALPVSDFPAPDSPTTPRISPASTEKESPSIAFRMPRRVGNSICRFSISMTVMRALPLAQFGIKRVAQPVADQIDREHQHDEGCRGEEGNPPLPGEEEVVADADRSEERRVGKECRW